MRTPNEAASRARHPSSLPRTPLGDLPKARRPSVMESDPGIKIELPRLLKPSGRDQGPYDGLYAGLVIGAIGPPIILAALVIGFCSEQFRKAAIEA